MSIKYPCMYWNDGLCKKFSDDKSTSWCVEGPCNDQMPSNADKIRAMSDEELVDLINREVSYCTPTSGDCEKTPNDCKACWLDWLQQPTAAPVVHGRWISLTDCSNAGVYCSICHKKVYKEDYAWCNKKNKVRSSYCPNCGAKMDEVNE